MLYKKAEKYCREVGITSLIEEKGAVIVALSGGADSSVLLSFFVDMRKDLPHLKIIAAHVNHMIRGEEADRDEEFCKEICQRHGIPLIIKKANVPALAKKAGEGLEECARNVRYSFFKELSKAYEALVATAHNADDNLETLIFNLTRGSGTKGMSGIAPVRDGVYIRPFLSLTGEEIRSFAKAEGIPYVIDSTNGDTAYTRNTIRHKVIPLLKEINPRVSDAGLRLSSAARADCLHLEREARIICQKIPVPKEEINALSPALFSRVIRELYKEASKKCENLSEKNVHDAKKLCQSANGGSVSLPGGYALYCDRDGVFVDRDLRYAEKSAFLSIPLCMGEAAEFCGFVLTLLDNDTYIKNIEENIYNLSLHIALDCDKINGNIHARTRQSGDTFLIHRTNKKLKKLLCDSAIPRHLRDTLPLICDGDGIIAVPTVGIRDGKAADNRTKQILHIIIAKKENKNN